MRGGNGLGDSCPKDSRSSGPRPEPTTAPHLADEVEISIETLPPGQGAAFAPLCAQLHARAFSDCWDTEAFVTLLQDPTVHCWIATLGDTQIPAAVAILRVVIDEAEILTIGTDPTYRRHGLAASLLLHAVGQLRRQGVGRLFLEVADDNEPAQALYRRLGFTQVGRRKAYYAPHGTGLPRRDALVMAKDLGP